MGVGQLVRNVITTETDPTVANFTKSLTSNNTILTAVNAASGTISASVLPSYVDDVLTLQRFRLRVRLAKFMSPKITTKPTDGQGRFMLKYRLLQLREKLLNSLHPGQFQLLETQVILLVLMVQLMFRVK
jgi:hypothetical protein